jgi:hypothetical protein
MTAKKTEKEDSEKKDTDEVSSEEEGYYCIYCSDYVEPGQYHHH